MREQPDHVWSHWGTEQKCCAVPGFAHPTTMELRLSAACARADLAEARVQELEAERAATASATSASQEGS